MQTMLKIVLCEDDPKQLSAISSMVSEILDKSAIDYKILLETTDAEAVLAFAQTNRSKVLYILDIHLSHAYLNGIELAKSIRRVRQEDEIILLTSDGDKMSTAFKNQLKVLDYIMKSTSEKIFQRLSESLLLLDSSEKKEQFVYTQNNQDLFIDLDEVLFVCTSGVSGKLELHSLNGIRNIYGTIKDIGHQNPELKSTHQAYLVNMENVMHYDSVNRMLIMVNGESCEVAFRKRAAMRKVFNNS